MNQIIEINNQEVLFELKESGTIFIDSLGIANVFDKRHDNIIRDIESLPQDDFTHLNFEVSGYFDKSGKRNKMYEMTRDGFSILVMGFAGKKAYEWKVQFINAFNELEKGYVKSAIPALAIPKESTQEINHFGLKIRLLDEYVRDVFKPKDCSKARASFKGQITKLQNLLKRKDEEVLSHKKEIKELHSDIRYERRERDKLQAKYEKLLVKKV